MAIKVIYSRTKDEYVGLAKRASDANKAGADAFVSIHCNAATSSARGFETFSFPGSSGGRNIATSVHNAVLRNSSLVVRDRGLKTANFAVLRLTNMPAALVELAFISNSLDARLLKTKQDEFAKQIAEGIRDRVGQNATVFLDAGHGGRDSGATGNGIREKDVALSVTLKIGKYLQGNVSKPKSKTTRNYVRQGDKGDSIIDIKQMQSDLIELGYGKGELKANGHFGSTTDKYVRQFQRDTAAKVNGAVGPKTLGIIKEMKNNKDLFYRTVTGSFKDKKEAETRVEELKKAGFDSFIDEYKK